MTRTVGSGDDDLSVIGGNSAEHREVGPLHHGRIACTPVLAPAGRRVNPGVSGTLRGVAGSLWEWESPRWSRSCRTRTTTRTSPFSGFACGSADSSDYVDRVFAAQAPGFCAPLCADEVFGNFQTAMTAGIVALVASFVGLFTGVIAVRR